MLNKKLMVVAVAGLFSTGAMAAGENNTGSCGWGAKVFDGQRGIAPQVLAATTNGTSGNQTFGITSGTSGCTHGWRGEVQLEDRDVHRWQQGEGGTRHVHRQR